MRFSFNLLDDPWIPCVKDTHAPPELLSVRAVLAQADTLRRIVDARPTATIALHRLLLALLHRALAGPRRTADWQTTWRRRSWDGVILDGYLQHWYARFDLFDPEYPFYQTPGLDPVRSVAVSTLAHDRASKVNSPMIFDHQREGFGVTPAEAALWLIGQQLFALPGLISDDQSSAGKVSAVASPLLGSLVCLAEGRTLFETLMLNWVQYDTAHALPFTCEGDDQPVWERTSPRFRLERGPAGYVDWLTWPSRRILLIPEQDVSGQAVVRRAVLMDGTRTPADFPIWERETMVAFHVNEKFDPAKPDTPPYFSTRLNPERAIWRESHALLNRFAEHASKPPKVLAVLATMEPRDLADYHVVPLAIAGVAFNKQTVVNWSQDTLVVPPHLLTSEVMVNALHKALRFAETMGKLLVPTEVTLGPKQTARPTPMKVLAFEYVKGVSERDPQSKEYHAFADHLGVSRNYWAALDLPFRALLHDLPGALTHDAIGNEIVGDAVQLRWLAAVKAACMHALQIALDSVGNSPRALRARALAESSQDICLKLAQADYLATLEGKVA